jgi:hypothetical protein
MEALKKCFDGFNEMVSYFGCESPIPCRDYVLVEDYTNKRWKYIRNYPKQYTFSIEETNYQGQTYMRSFSFHAIRNRKMYVKNEYVLLTERWTEHEIVHYVYLIFDNSKLIPEGSV